jgi:hypothetical protein
MAADAWKFYYSFKEYVGDGGIDLDTDTFKIILLLSTSNAATLTLTNYAGLTNEVATNFGYTQGGLALNSPTWVTATTVTTFDVSGADPVWTASGGSITARFAAIFDDTSTVPSADLLVCYSLLDNAPADVTATTGNTFTVAMHASGVFTFTDA